MINNNNNNIQSPGSKIFRVYVSQVLKKEKGRHTNTDTGTGTGTNTDAEKIMVSSIEQDDFYNKGKSTRQQKKVKKNHII